MSDLERYRVYFMLRRRHFKNWHFWEPQKAKAIQFIPRTWLGRFPVPLNAYTLHQVVGHHSDFGKSYDRFYSGRFPWRQMTKAHYGQIVRRTFNGDIKWG